MIKTLLFSISILLTSMAYGQSCKTIKNIKGFYTTPLFDNPIINGTSLDYYTFVSKCNESCLLRHIESHGLDYSLDGSNLAVFDKRSVSTLILEKSGKDFLSGYLTCSSQQIRQYISHPLRLELSKVTLDLQSEDTIKITRTISLQGYSNIGYAKLINQLNNISKSKSEQVGFLKYKIQYKQFNQEIMVSKLTPRGNFMIVIEVTK